MEWIGLIWLRIGTSGGLLWTRYWTFCFHKMLGRSWGAAQLAASEDWLSADSKSQKGILCSLHSDADVYYIWIGWQPSIFLSIFGKYKNWKRTIWNMNTKRLNYKKHYFLMNTLGKKNAPRLPTFPSKVFGCQRRQRCLQRGVAMTSDHNAM
jgi:hypothetical protein